MDVSGAWQHLFGLKSPGKVVCVGLNYRDHADESDQALPAEPLLFGKFSNAIVGPGDPILLPEGVGHVDAEAELAIVMGRRASQVAADEALDHVYGYTAANDISAREIQFADGQWFRGKGFDTFCPLYPHVVPVDVLGDASGLRVVQRLNGEVIQDGLTNSLVFDVPTLVAHVSSVLTLEPGDLILTGTPPGVGFFRDPKISLAPGDEVEVEIEGIGSLSNPVRARSGDLTASHAGSL